MKHFPAEKIFGYILLFVLEMALPAWLNAQNKVIQLPEESLKSRIEWIATNSGRNIIYDDKSFSNIQVPAINSESRDINILLSKSLVSTGFTFKSMPDNSIVIKRLSKEVNDTAAPRGKGILQGTVLDEKGSPITGATVSVPGTTIGTTTDADGKYKLSNIPLSLIHI